MIKFLALALAVLTLTSCGDFVPKNYTKIVETGGEIEKTYLEMGKNEVSQYQQEVTDEIIKSHVVFYPSNIKSQTQKLPAIIFSNGTGVIASKYPALFRHLASWGFIIIGNEVEHSGNGYASDKAMEFLIKENQNRQSPIYNMVDMDNIGISGHSQGGAGVFNAITDDVYGKYYKTAVALSPTNEEAAAGLNWPYNPALVNMPTLLLAGTVGEFETKMVIPIERMEQIYNKLQGPKVMARKSKCEHGQMLYCADGYVTAWFMWLLKGDKNAAKAFMGDSPEIENNKLYQNVKIDL